MKQIEQSMVLSLTPVNYQSAVLCSAGEQPSMYTTYSGDHCTAINALHYFHYI